MDITIIIALIVGISEFVKGFLPLQIKNFTITKKLIPLLDMALAFMFVTGFTEFTGKELIIQSLIVGLSASGLYSGFKNVKQQYTPPTTNDDEIKG